MVFRGHWKILFQQQGGVMGEQQSCLGAGAQQSRVDVGAAGAAAIAFISLITSPRQQPPLGLVISQRQFPAFTSALMDSSIVLFPVWPQSSRMLSALWSKQ